MWLRALFVEHFWLKLFSLLLAMLVWLAVRANVVRESSSREFDAREATRNFVGRPILIMTDSGAHPPVVVDPPTVDIALRGLSQRIEKLEAQDIRAFVRIPDRPDFEGSVPVHVNLPADTALVIVSPATVRIKPVENP